MLGSGTQTDPYKISTPQDLNAVRNNLTAYYELANDIDMSSFGNFTPIGNSSTKFKGNFNGKGYKIKNLTINISSQDVGLFGYTENATIQNVAIENADVTSNMQNYVGILVGNITTSTISNCYTTGNVSGQYGVGGLVGWHTSGLIQNCFSHAKVTGKGRVGGLVGNGVTIDSKVEKCYSTGLVTVTPDPNLYNGGLVGSHIDSTKVTDSYFDINTSGQTISAGGTGKTTTEMKQQSTYINWDFTSIWGINNDYPYLQIFGISTPSGVVEERQVVSYITDISSTTEIIKKISKNINSYAKYIVSDVNALKNKSIHVNSYMFPIYANVLSQNKTNKIINIQSYVDKINSNIWRQTKAYRQPTSYMKLIDSKVILPGIILPFVCANSWYEQNLSNSSTIENLSNISCIENPSHLEVIS
ncbi:GLUG motif-containing protein [Desulfotomaculum nigrificans]|uniref:GLUG motif-containing protein n=1 Tax=Desulfotomaculum nigrificans TaxID=1565 RepID=UPI0001FAECE8|nr:GLUG motif-containing protein [Desulfotomaculum nigrificans]